MASLPVSGTESPGKRTLTEAIAPIQAASVQRRADAAGPRSVEVGPPRRDDSLLRVFGRRDARPSGAPGTGRTMPAGVQDKMERAFAADFSTVRIHEGERASTLGAIAYAQGEVIHFAPGRYDPHSLSGQALLGHELAHVVQQRAGRVSVPSPDDATAAARQAAGACGDAHAAVVDDPALEAEADRQGTAAARGEAAVTDRAAGSAAAVAPGAAVQRRTDGMPIQRVGELVAAGHQAGRAPGGGGDRNRGRDPGGQHGTEDAVPGLDLPEALRPLVQALLAAIRDGHLVISAAQRDALLRLLHSVIEELRGPALVGSGHELNGLDGRALLPLSRVISFVLQTDVTPFLGGVDILLEPRFFQRHPLDVTGLDLGGAARPHSPPGRAVESGAAPAHVFGPPLPPGVRQWITHLVLYPHALREVQWTYEAVQFDAPSAALLVPMIVGHLPFPQAQVRRAAQIFAASGQQVHAVKGWIDAGRKPQQAPQAPHVHPLVGPPQPALDALLGAGAHAQITGAITAGHCVFEANPFVVAHARTLLAEGMAPANVRTLLVNVCGHTARRTVFDRAVRIARGMHRSGCAFLQIYTFIHHHPAVALAKANQRALLNPGNRRNALLRRTEQAGDITAADLVRVLGILAPLGLGAAALLTNRFPATLGLTLPRLHARLENFTGAGLHDQNIAIGDVSDEFTAIENSINQRLQRGQMSAEGAGWAHSAFRLLTQATRAQMLQFLGHAAIRGHMASKNANPLFHLLQFARYHTGAAPGGFAPVTVPVRHRTGLRHVDIDASIIDHIRERHTWENFRFTPDIINRADTTTYFPATITDRDLRQQIEQTLGRPEVCNGEWNNGVIQVDALQIRIEFGGRNYRIRSYFYVVGAGTRVRREVLHAIHACFPFL